MNWSECRPGTVVYHRIFTHWGKGVVQKVVPTNGLEAIFERGDKRALVTFEHEEGICRMRCAEISKKPNRRKIKDMVEFYQERGVDAKDGSDRLVLPDGYGKQEHPAAPTTTESH